MSNFKAALKLIQTSGGNYGTGVSGVYISKRSAIKTVLRRLIAPGMRKLGFHSSEAVDLAIHSSYSRGFSDALDDEYDN